MPGARSFALGSALAAIVALRARYLRWGATDVEAKMVLPGDELMPRADLTATRAVSIQADSDAVWPWVAQLGQGRGGFYSYDFLDNLIGCDIHSADRVMPEFQDIAVGEDIRLAPQVSLVIASLDPGRSLVLRGGIPIGNNPAPYDFTWAFTLQDEPDDNTRLLVRERYAYTRSWARLLVEPTEAVSFVMSQKMLRGIKNRAERTASSPRAKPARRNPAARVQRFSHSDASPSLPAQKRASSMGEETRQEQMVCLDELVGEDVVVPRSEMPVRLNHSGLKRTSPIRAERRGVSRVPAVIAHRGR